VLFLRQFNYTIEYRETSEHSNADVLSRLPVDDDTNSNKDESTDDVDTVDTIDQWGGLGVKKKPLSLIFYKNVITFARRKCFRIRFAC